MTVSPATSSVSGQSSSAGFVDTRIAETTRKLDPAAAEAGVQAEARALLEAMPPETERDRKMTEMIEKARQ